jgi:hypothetical protein
MHFFLNECLFRELIICRFFPRHLQTTPNPKVEVEMMFGDSNDDNDDDNNLTTE